MQLDAFPTCVGAVCAPGTPLRNHGFPTTLSGSAYGDGTYRFRRATRLTVDLRYTDERKTLSGLVTPLPGLPDLVAVVPGSAVFPLPAGGVTYPGEPYTATVNGVSTVQPGIPTRLVFKS